MQFGMSHFDSNVFVISVVGILKTDSLPGSALDFLCYADLEIYLMPTPSACGCQFSVERKVFALEIQIFLKTDLD